jgi:uncharacterized protein with FMN-binding domain
MRRAVPAILLTLLGLGALASFKTTPGITGTIKVSAPPPRRSTPTTAPPPTTAPSPHASAPPATRKKPTPATNPPATAPPTTQAPAVTTTRTLTGDPIDNRFGTVQVRVTMRGNQITAVDALQMPYDHQQSAYISQQAEPYLQQEALQAQSANIQIVTGATYTSESYAQSLQSALSKA